MMILLYEYNNYHKLIINSKLVYQLVYKLLKKKIKIRRLINFVKEQE